MRAVVLLLAVCTLWPMAQAGGRVDTPLGTGVIADEFGNDCGLPASVPCVFDADVRGTSPGDWSLDVYQSIDYVGVASNDSGIEAMTGVPLLPDHSMMIRGSDLYLEHPVFVIASGVVNQSPRLESAGMVYEVEWNSSRLTIIYFGPSVAEKEVADQQEWWFGHGGLIGYDKQGPHNAPGGNSTDNYLVQAGSACKFSADAEQCGTDYNATLSVQRNSTPDARLGVKVYDAQVATNPELLDSRRAAAVVLLDDPVSSRKGPEEVLPADIGRDDDGLSGTPRETPLKTFSERRLPAAAPSRFVAPEAVVEDLIDPSGVSVIAIVGASAAVIAIISALLAYSRFARSDEVLTSPTRKIILGTVTADPGVDLREVVRQLGVSRNAVQYHIRQLEKAQLIQVTREGAHQYLWPSNASPLTVVPSGLARHPVARRIVESVQQAGEFGRPRGDVHTLAGAPRRTSNHLLAQLIRAGVLSERDTADRRIVMASSTLGK